MHDAICSRLARVLGLALLTGVPAGASVVVPPTPYDEGNYVLTVGTPSLELTRDHFTRGAYWSDGEPPRPGKKYYVTPELVFMTPWGKKMVEANEAEFPDTYHTFQGDMLVVGGAFWYLVGTPVLYTVPDLHLLPGSSLCYTTGQNPGLDGVITVHGTAADPAHLRVTSDSRVSIPADWRSAPDGCLRVHFGEPLPFAYPVDGNGQYVLKGRFDAYLGTIQVCASARPDLSGEPYVQFDGVTALAGTLHLAGGWARFNAEGAVTVGALRLEDGARLTLFASGSTQGPRAVLTVTNSIQTSGTAFLELSSAFTGHAPEGIDLIRFVPGVDVSQIAASSFQILNGAYPAPAYPLTLRAEADGAHVLGIAPQTVVTRLNVSEPKPQNAFENAANTDGAHYWSDSRCPGPSGADNAAKTYVCRDSDVTAPTNTGIYRLDCRAFVLDGRKMDTSYRGLAFSCGNFILRNASFIMGNNNVKLPRALRDQDGELCAAYAIRGRLHAYGDNTFATYGRVNGLEVYLVEAEVDGDGSITATSTSSSSTNNIHGVLELTALNTNYTGRIFATMKDTEQYHPGIVTPNMLCHPHLYISDERNLGGRRGTFAYNALHLEQYAQLFIRKDVTLSDGYNRGVSIGNVGRVLVTNNLTLAILRPLTVNGRFIKEGAGTLALGGTLRFGGDAQSETPTASSNVLEVAAGSLQPLTAQACDGLALTFAPGASLKLDGGTTNAALRQYGLYNVKEEAAPLAFAGDRFAVDVAYDAAWTPPAPVWKVGLLTVKDAVAATLADRIALARPKVLNRYRGAVAAVPNGDGTTTFVATYKPMGCTLFIR